MERRTSAAPPVPLYPVGKFSSPLEARLTPGIGAKILPEGRVGEEEADDEEAEKPHKRPTAPRGGRGGRSSVRGRGSAGGGRGSHSERVLPDQVGSPGKHETIDLVDAPSSDSEAWVGNAKPYVWPPHQVAERMPPPPKRAAAPADQEPPSKRQQRGGSTPDHLHPPFTLAGVRYKWPGLRPQPVSEIRVDKYELTPEEMLEVFKPGQKLSAHEFKAHVVETHNRIIRER